MASVNVLVKAECGCGHGSALARAQASLMRHLPEPGSRRTTDTTKARRDFLTSLSRCQGDPNHVNEPFGYWIRVHRRAMACRFEITLSASDAGFLPAARAALDQIDELEAELSIFRETSTISRLNRLAAVGPVGVSRPVLNLLVRCHRLHRDTGGAFDVTTLPLTRCWGFLRREGRVPDGDALATARAAVGFDHVHVSAERAEVSFARPDIELNLGAIGKGYALDRAGTGLEKAGIRQALLSAGRSSLLALGGPPEGWPIDLVSPVVARRPLARLWLRNAALGTSGAGEQFVVSDGRRYGHVIDPRTGWPAHGVVSATVVASDAAAADALSTAFLVGGIDLAREYCAEHRDVLALITPDDGSGRPVAVGGHPGARLLRSDRLRRLS